MKIVKNKYGKVFLVLGAEENFTIHKDFNMKYKGATIPLGTVETLTEAVSTDVLEDVFFLAQAELMERDRAEIEKGVRYE